MEISNFEMPRPDNRVIYGCSWLPNNKDIKDIIILIHGLGEHFGRYKHWAAKFCANSLGVYAIDLPGHGRSSGKRGHIDHFNLIYDDVAELVSVVKKNHPNHSIHIYGHSMGGALALGAAINRNFGQSSVILTGPAIVPGFQPPAWKISLAKFLDRWMPGLLLGNELDINGISRDPKVIAAYKADPLVHGKLSVRWFNEWLRCVEQLTLRSSQEIPSPVLILHGEKDRLTSPLASEQFARKLGQNITFKLWPDALHELHNEPDQNEVFEFIFNWLKKSGEIKNYP
jgi:alpha-beta hydrolase superfamily lysophospholipase